MNDVLFFFSSRRRHTRCGRDWSSDVCSSDLLLVIVGAVDDARDLPAKFRLGVQVLLGAVLTFGSGTSLVTFGDLLGFGPIELGILGPLVTIAAVIGAKIGRASCRERV